VLDDKHQFDGLAEQVRFLMMRGIETVQAERAGRPQRPQWIEVRQSDFSYDRMKAWIPTRQSFV
jgi:hypothetical protein